MRSLCLPRNLCPQMSCKQCCNGANQALVKRMPVEQFLTRPPWKAGRNPAVEGNSEILISRLGTLVSTKGSDILLKAETEPVVTYDKLRTTVPAHLWSWKTVCGWRWKYGQSPEQQEHINKLELRAVLTSIRWRIFKQRIKKTRFLHLVDSLVSLHILNKEDLAHGHCKGLSKRSTRYSCFAHSGSPRLCRYGVQPGRRSESARNEETEMGKRRIIEGNSQEARKMRRQELGPLKSLIIKPATLERYRRAADHFFAHLRRQRSRSLRLLKLWILYLVNTLVNYGKKATRSL